MPHHPDEIKKNAGRAHRFPQSAPPAKYPLKNKGYSATIIQETRCRSNDPFCFFVKKLTRAFFIHIYSL